MTTLSLRPKFWIALAILAALLTLLATPRAAGNERLEPVELLVPQLGMSA